MSKEIGNELEKKISSALGINRTTNSGAKWDNADLANRKLIIEAKVKMDKASFSAPKSELKKLKREAEKHGKDWLYFQKNQTGIYVLLDLDTFLELTELYFKNK